MPLVDDYYIRNGSSLHKNLLNVIVDPVTVDDGPVYSLGERVVEVDSGRVLETRKPSLLYSDMYVSSIVTTRSHLSLEGTE